ncbi:hypothetical protein D3C75_1110870 [compost metagenome]
MAVGHLLVDLEVFVTAHFDAFFFLALLFLATVVGTGVGLIGQQVLQVDGQAVTGGHPQHQRTWTLVGTQRNLARHRRTTLGQ